MKQIDEKSKDKIISVTFMVLFVAYLLYLILTPSVYDIKSWPITNIPTETAPSGDTNP